jgi:hypothetical protein
MFSVRVSMIFLIMFARKVSTPVLNTISFFAYADQSAVHLTITGSQSPPPPHSTRPPSPPPRAFASIVAPPSNRVFLNVLRRSINIDSMVATRFICFSLHIKEANIRVEHQRHRSPFVHETQNGLSCVFITYYALIPLCTHLTPDREQRSATCAWTSICPAAPSRPAIATRTRYFICIEMSFERYRQQRGTIVDIHSCLPSIGTQQISKNEFSSLSDVHVFSQQELIVQHRVLSHHLLLLPACVTPFIHWLHALLTGSEQEQATRAARAGGQHALARRDWRNANVPHVLL